MIDPGLDGRVALVTGANRGIGAATAHLLAAQENYTMSAAQEVGPYGVTPRWCIRRRPTPAGSPRPCGWGGAEPPQGHRRCPWRRSGAPNGSRVPARRGRAMIRMVPMDRRQLPQDSRSSSARDWEVVCGRMPSSRSTTVVGSQGTHRQGHSTHRPACPAPQVLVLVAVGVGCRRICCSLLPASLRRPG
jgi:hypothetical protein